MWKKMIASKSLEGKEKYLEWNQMSPVQQNYIVVCICTKKALQIKHEMVPHTVRDVEIRIRVLP